MNNPSPPLTPQPELSSNEIHRIVRSEFDQTWIDYYAWKPPSTLPLINGELEKGSKLMDEELVQRHQSLGDGLRRLLEEADEDEGGQEKEEEAGRPDMDEDGDGDFIDQVEENKRHDDSFMGARKPITLTDNHTSTHLYLKPHHPTRRNNQSNLHTHSPNSSTKQHHRSKPKSLNFTNVKKLNLLPISTNFETATCEEGIYTLYNPDYNPSKKVKTIPPYFFCVKGQSSICKEDERSMPFIPIFVDYQDFDEHKYFRSFGSRAAWEGTWRDPEGDIIQVEALRRIRLHQHNITTEQIDKTKILPSTVVRIEDLELSRDLLPFPLQPDLQDQNQKLSKRKWGVPIEPTNEIIGQYSIDDYGEFLCGRQSCTIFGCPRHATLDENHLSLQSASIRQRPTQKSYIPRKRFKLPSVAQPCSDTCYSLVDPTYLMRKAMKALPWPAENSESLIEMMSDENDDIIGEDICHLGIHSDGYTCRAVATQILSLALKSPIPPITADEDSDQTPAPATSAMLKFKVKSSDRIRLKSSQAVLNAQECNHSGPCTAKNCWCFKNDWTCGRNCICPSNCVRRFRGCRCWKIASNNGLKPGKGACLPGKCPCSKGNRECDPEICGPCGAHEEIAFARKQRLSRAHVNGYDLDHVASETEDISRANCCGNVGIQKAVWPKLRVGISPVSGYGIFAGEPLDKDQMIGEYIGEVITPMEGERRDQINNQIGRQYIFTLNAESEIDAGNYGNITRYFNSAKGNAVNIEAKTVVVGNEQRIAFRTTRSIKQNEEIRFDYGERFDENATEKADNKKNRSMR
ncbi:uncharacterized protein IL334_000679 [Kwoniella shivajii]|uniref:SET domain-containing protein n=1 Tax=Kwoniella shivajii TaxID=564305 RepID=A0ABZ1CRB0_9TREE|nr:hypothetical protein IL334_000679 [Kwoniella shivajii]